MSEATEEYIETVDTRQLQEHDWPILRLFAPSFLDRLALARCQRRLLASCRWEQLRAVPRRDAQRGASPTVFDLYGTPVQPGANTSLTPKSRPPASRGGPSWQALASGHQIAWSIK